MNTPRSYRSQDFDELWRIDQECFQQGIAYSRRELAWYMNRSRAFTLVAEEEAGRKIMGFGVAESDPAGIGHILTIHLHPVPHRPRTPSLLLHPAHPSPIHNY